MRARLEEEARCMEQPEAQGTAEVAADIRAALQRVKELERQLANTRVKRRDGR